MSALAIWSPEDGVLGAVAPLALAAAAGTALALDLDPDGPRYPGEAKLARLVAESPRRSDLEPAANGVAVLANGGIEPEAAEEVLAALVRSWPSVVFRLPADHRGGDGAVPIVPLLPGNLFAGVAFQRCISGRCGTWSLPGRGSFCLGRGAPRSVRFSPGRLPVSGIRGSGRSVLWERRWM